MPKVEIPNVGVVEFPDSMPQADIDSNAARLYAETQGPGSRQATQSLRQTKNVGLEAATASLPAIGGMAGSAFGGIPGAFIGGVVMQNVRQIGNKILGIKAPSGPLEELKAGAEQGTYEILGLGTMKVANKVLGPFARKAASPVIKEVRELAERFGVKLTPGQAVDSPTLRAIEYAGTLTSPGRRVASVRRIESLDALRTAVEKTLNELSPESSPMAAGTALKNAVDVAKKNFNEGATKLYQAVDEAAGQTPVVDTGRLRKLAESTRSSFSRLKKDFGSISGDTGELKAILDDLAPAPQAMKIGGKVVDPSQLSPAYQAALKTETSAAPPVLSFAEANQLRSDLLSRARESGKADVVAFVKRATETLHEDMQKAAVKLGPDVLEKWNTAREYYASGKKLMESQTYGALLKRDPDVLVQSVRPNAVTDLQEVKGAILGLAKDEQAFDGFRRQWLAGQLKGMSGELEDLVKVPNIVRGWNKEFRAEMFHDLKGKIALRNLEQIGEVLETVGKKSALSGLQHLSEAYHIVSVAGAIATGNVGTGAKILAGTYYTPYLITKVIQSPQATRYLVDGLGQVPKNTGKALANITRAFTIAAKGIKAIEDTND